VARPFVVLPDPRSVVALDPASTGSQIAAGEVLSIPVVIGARRDAPPGDLVRIFRHSAFDPTSFTSLRMSVRWAWKLDRRACSNFARPVSAQAGCTLVRRPQPRCGGPAARSRSARVALGC
jgi:hypothetical protein